MLIKPDKPPSQTTSYRPISLLSAIMKLFERVIEKRLRKHLEDNGFFSKYQSGFSMLIKPDKPPSQTTSYRPISLLSAIMKLFERVIEKRLRKHLEDNSFFSKYQSGFRKSKSTNDHLFRLSQTIMESFNRGEHVIADFLDVEKAFDNVWHNGLGYKIYQLDLPTKLCRWLSDFLVGRLIQVKIEGSYLQKLTQKQVFHKVQT